jgi:membrane-associated protease RseP (regulator of RpoE activity)
MKRAVFTLAFAGLLTNLLPALADDDPAKKSTSPGTNQAGQKQTYLGLAVVKVPRALASQMPGILPKGQGVLIMQVAKDSPAEKAGLKTDDILLSYGDQKLSSPEQLVKLVRGDKSGHEVSLNYIRAGKPENCKVTLGEHESVNLLENPHVFRLQPDKSLQEIFEQSESKNGGSAWESFDSLKLSRQGDKGWHAEIDYRTKDGKKEHKVFNGTREEIRKAVQAEKDLPANERNHLLRALNLHNPVFEFHIPPLFDQLVPDYRP